MGYKPNQKVNVLFGGVWCEGQVMSCKQGYVMAHIDKPSSSLLPGMVPDRPIVCVHADKVKPAQDDDTA